MYKKSNNIYKKALISNAINTLKQLPYSDKSSLIMGTFTADTTSSHLNRLLRALDRVRNQCANDTKYLRLRDGLRAIINPFQPEVDALAPNDPDIIENFRLISELVAKLKTLLSSQLQNPIIALINDFEALVVITPEGSPPVVVNPE